MGNHQGVASVASGRGSVNPAPLVLILDYGYWSKRAPRYHRRLYILIRAHLWRRWVALEIVLTIVKIVAQGRGVSVRQMTDAKHGKSRAAAHRTSLQGRRLPRPLLASHATWYVSIFYLNLYISTVARLHMHHYHRVVKLRSR